MSVAKLYGCVPGTLISLFDDWCYIILVSITIIMFGWKSEWKSSSLVSPIAYIMWHILLFIYTQLVALCLVQWSYVLYNDLVSCTMVLSLVQWCEKNKVYVFGYNFIK